jgi:hypothetical protein
MMVINMRLAVALLGCLNLASAAELTVGRTVFLMPMSHNLDQFIVNSLTQMHVLQVVTDPAKADIVMTEQVGAAFESRLNDLYSPPADPKPAVAAKEPKAKPATPDEPEAHGLASMLGDPANKPDKQGSMGLYGRGRGTIFLVDVQSRQVLWSAFDKPKSSSPYELDRTAHHIVKRLKEDLTPKAAK